MVLCIIHFFTVVIIAKEFQFESNPELPDYYQRPSVKLIFFRKKINNFSSEFSSKYLITYEDSHDSTQYSVNLENFDENIHTVIIH